MLQKAKAGRGRPRRHFHVTGLNNDERLCLSLHSQGRGISADQLLRQIVRTVLHDNLVDAVLDDAQDQSRRSGTG